jgi:hypothetical protein
VYGAIAPSSSSQHCADTVKPPKRSPNEAAVVAIDKDAAAEVHALAATILRQVLSSADHVRSKESGFAHAWERKAYADYEASAMHTAGALNSARGRIGKTRLLCGQ